jgi:Arc/MetJ family transcription regulator
MRTNIDIDDELLAKAMQAGPYATKKETVEAGLRLLARQAAYREILKWQGKLKWEGDESIDWTKAPLDEDGAGVEPVDEAGGFVGVRESAPPFGQKKGAGRAGR